MTSVPRTIDRRSLLKAMGAAGTAAGLAATGRLPGLVPPQVRASGVTQSDIEPYEIRVSDAAIEDLQRRLRTVRWPADTPGDAWAYGTDRAYLQELVAYWRDEYDWRRHEAELNTFDHFRTTIDGQRIHFVHQQGRGPSRLPLVGTHGWPGSMWEMLPSVRALTDPAAHGGVAADAFDVVVPSIPGFGFSGEPAEGTDMGRTAELWAALMARLGYQRYGAYGNDWGAGVTRQLGARFPDRLVGVYWTGSPGPQDREPETDAEREYQARAAAFAVDETGYQRIQQTRPQTLAYGLTDSPVGLAAWLTEKLRAWSDSHGDVETRFTKDQILTLVSMFWYTNSIGTSVRYYHANAQDSSLNRTVAAGPVRVPGGMAEFVRDPFRGNIPRSYVADPPEHVTHWSVFDTGGHFATIEEPELLVQDLRAFFRPLR